MVVHQLANTAWDFTPYQKIQKFVDGLLFVDGYIGLKDRIRTSWLAGPHGTYDFTALAEEVLEIDIDRRRHNRVPHSSQANRPSAPRNQPSTSTSTSNDPTNVVPPTSSDSTTPLVPTCPVPSAHSMLQRQLHDVWSYHQTMLG